MIEKRFRKGKYGNNKSIEKILSEFKEKTKRTEKEYLFKSLDKIEFDSLRKKSLYGLKEYYYELADCIFQKSFIKKQ